jgi:hypothetical protein
VTALFGRLNLRNLQCQELRIITYVKISSGLAKRIISAYHERTTRDTPRSAVYGTTYAVNKIPHAIRVHVWHEEGNEYRIEFAYVDQKRPKPPKNVKSPQLLIDLLNEEPQEIELICFADFVYKQDEWRSIIEIPIALNSSKESDEPFTHIEAIEFSRRENSNIQYSVLIGKLEDGTTTHSTYFVEPWKGKLTREIPTLLSERSNKLSKVLVSRKRWKKYGS